MNKGLDTYSEMGGTARQSILTSSDSDLALFQNIQPVRYWSGTEFALNTNAAWSFDFTGGFQGPDFKFISLRACVI